jgi:hypothetical protein
MTLRDRIGIYLPAFALKPALTKQQTMSVSPVHNDLVTWKKLEGGEIMLSIPRRADRLGKIIGVVFRVPDFKEIVLDEVGSSVWELCDGKHDMSGIIAETSRLFKLNRREAEVSVTTYIKMLAERKLVGLVQRGGKSRHGRK